MSSSLLTLLLLPLSFPFLFLLPTSSLLSSQEALLPGVFSLLKLCTDNDLAFVKASLDTAARESLQALVAEYLKFYKFSGRV